MTTGGAREQAYANLVSALLDARDDPATARFDEELARGVDAGMVSADAARALRFWQRATLKALVDHARSVLPPALTALDASRAGAHDVVGAVGGSPGDPHQIPSSPAAQPPSSLDERRRRFLVAGLTNASRNVAQSDRPQDMEGLPHAHPAPPA